MSPVIKPGMRVRLKEDKAEGWPEQWAHVIEIWPTMSTAMVCLTKEYREGPEDDGLRDITIDQIVEVQP